MKKVKSNLLYIISFLILLLIFGSFTINFLSNEKQREKTYIEQKEECLNKQIFESEAHQEYCQKIIENDFVKYDFYTAFMEIYVHNGNKIAYITCLFIIVPLLINICSYFKNKIILNDLTRSNYKDVKIKIFKESLKASVIVPLILVIVNFICYLYSNDITGTFAINNSSTIWEDYLLTHYLIFILAYITRTFLLCFIYANISICIARSSHNVFISILLTILTILGIEIFLEIFINGIIFSTIFKSDVGIIFNILSIFAFNDSFGVILPLFILLIILLLILFLKYKLYNDKEKLIIECEKNE